MNDSLLRAYLAPAEYVDSTAPAIISTAADLTASTSSATEVAARLFEFVRDLPYEADDFQALDSYRASRVLQVRHGYCAAKAGLLAALARASGIPAAVAFADVRNHLASERLREAMGTDVFAWHGYTRLWLDGHWIDVSPTFDPETCRRAGVEPLTFDGRSDALLQAFTGGGTMDYVVRHGTFHDIPARFLAVEMPHRYPFVADGGLERFKAGSSDVRTRMGVAQCVLPEQSPLHPLVRIDRLDHLVLTVADLEATVGFYSRVLGMEPVTFGQGRRALLFGQSKINLHETGHEFEPKAAHAVPGSADLCLISAVPLEQVIAELVRHDVRIEEGPIRRTGALGRVESIYLRDPDRNLIEISVYVEPR